MCMNVYRRLRRPADRHILFFYYHYILITYSARDRRKKYSTMINSVDRNRIFLNIYMYIYICILNIRYLNIIEKLFSRLMYLYIISPRRFALIINDTLIESTIYNFKIFSQCHRHIQSGCNDCIMYTLHIDIHLLQCFIEERNRE